jgi:Tfp pilus assembly major pilin PilA
MERNEVIEKLKNCGWNYPDIPCVYYKDYEIAVLAVTHSFRALDYIPQIYITKRLCEIAVDCNCMAIDHMPEKYKTIELRLIALKNGGTIAWTDFPDGRKSAEYYKLAVNIESWVLYYIPEQYITEEMCFLAVQQYGMEVIEENIIPEKYKTEGLIQFAKQIKKMPEYKPLTEKADEVTFTKLINSVDTTIISKILKNIDLHQLATAMKLTTETTRQKILDNIGENKKKLEEAYDYIGPSRLLDVLEAQRCVNTILTGKLKKYGVN